MAGPGWPLDCQASGMSKIRTPLSGRWLAIVGACFVAMLGSACLLATPLQALLHSEAVRGVDRAAWEYAGTMSSPAWVAAMVLVSDLHGTVGILVLAAACAWAWRHFGHPDACVRLLVAVPAGMVLNVLVKAAIARVRPDWALVDLPRSFSFPSGHVAEATVFYGALAIEAAALRASAVRRAAFALAAAAMVAIVACSRIVLGVHFLSDCIGAFVESVLWLAACFSGRPLKPSPVIEGRR